MCDLKKLVLGLEQLHCLLCVVDGEEPRNVGVVALSCVFGVDVTLYFFTKKENKTYFTYAHTCGHIMYYILTKKKQRLCRNGWIQCELRGPTVQYFLRATLGREN